MQSYDISIQVVESISSNFSCTSRGRYRWKIPWFLYGYEFQIRNNRLTERSDLRFAVIFPIGTDGSMMFRITIMFVFSFSSTSSFFCGKFVDTVERAATLTFYFLCLFFLPCFIRPPISLDSLTFLSAQASTSCLMSRFLLSSSSTSHLPAASFILDLFLIFCFTISDFLSQI